MRSGTHHELIMICFFLYSKDGEKKRITQMLVYHRNEEEEAE